MKTGFVSSAAVLSLLAASAAVAQDKPAAFVMATYYRCVQGDASRADALYKEHVAPLLKAEQAAGNITAYGWSKHWEGGDWRRLEYAVGTDLDKMLDSRATVIKATQAPEHVKAMDEFDRVCSSHDDYIWGVQAASQTPDTLAKARPAFGMSTYFACSSREDEADAIVKTAFAPILNQHVKDGKVASWIWLEHLVGGKYRRALVFDGASEKAMLGYWRVLWSDLEKQQAAFTRRFTEICDSHTDYVWQLGEN